VGVGAAELGVLEGAGSGVAVERIDKIGTLNVSAPSNVTVPPDTSFMCSLLHPTRKVLS
jgi:hypothetical protein